MADHDEGWVEEEEDAIDELEIAIDAVLDDFVPKILAGAIDLLANERDGEVLEELRQSQSATEVSVIKEALREAETHNLIKTDEADGAREWLTEIQKEIEIFDLIREQRRITTELEGSSQLLKLIGKAYDLNLPVRAKQIKSTGRGQSQTNAHPDLDNSNLALRMGTQDATEHFALDAYEEDEDEESQLEGRASLLLEDEEGSFVEDSESEEDYEELFWDSLDDSDEEGDEGQSKPQIDVLSLWRMRVPRHRKLLKDSVMHLGGRERLEHRHTLT